MQLKEDGGIKALLGMVQSGHDDVIAQIARGIANFAKCESRAISHGQLFVNIYTADDSLMDMQFCFFGKLFTFHCKCRS
jgi:hypothetical protein